MNITNVQYVLDEKTSSPKLIVTLEMLIEPLKDIHTSSNQHKQEILAAIGNELLKQIKAANINVNQI